MTSETDSLGGYQQAVRERASGSMAGLRHVLDSRPVLSPEARRSIPLTKSPRSAGSAWERSRNTERADYSYGAAVDRLRYSLRRLEPVEKDLKSVQFGHRFSGSMSGDVPVFMYHPPSTTSDLPPRGPIGEIPSAEETMPLLQNQSVIVQQLEAENKFCREELRALKMKVHEVIEENQLLHEEIKKGVMQEITGQGIDLPGMPRDSAGGLMSEGGSGGPRQAMTKQEYSKWHQEVERVRVLHEAKCTRLEAQLQHSREEQRALEKEAEELRSRVRAVESLAASDPNLLQLAAGLCVRCAQNEAVLAPSGSKVTLERLTRERDELVEQLGKMKGRCEQLRQREDEWYAQVKSSVQLAEQAQLEMTQALVEREQLKEELESARQRTAEHAEELLRKVQQERQLIRAETLQERDELRQQVSQLGAQLAESQSQVERLSRDKVDLMTEVGHKKGQIDHYDEEYGKATDSMKMSMTQASTERNAAIAHVRRLKQEMDQMQRDRDNERVRLKTELEDIKRRLHEAERELVETKEECIQLHSTTQALEREAHLAKMAKESIEKNRSDDLKAMMKRAEQREVELNIMIDTLEARNEHSSNELEAIVNSQGTLVLKLREECRKLAARLEDVTHKYRGDNKKLKTQNDYMRGRLEKSLRHQRALEDCASQHGLLQDKMRERIKQMDGHAQTASQQIMDLLAKESALMRDRHLLASEVEFLRRQMSSADRKKADEYYSGTRHLVNEILNNVRYEQEEKQKGIVGREEEHQEAPVIDEENLFKKKDEEYEESFETPTEEDIDLE